MMIPARRIGIVGVLTLSVAAMIGSRARAQSQDTYNFETKKGHITVVGCLKQLDDGKHNKYVLAKPTMGPAESTTEASCDADPAAATFQLEDATRGAIDESMIGHWVEITGRLGGVQDRNGLRRLHARESKLVPVIVPKAAEAAPSVPPPAPTYQPPVASEPAPAPLETIGTTGVIEKKLPKTASQLPLTGLLSLIAIATGLLLRQMNRSYQA